MDLPFLLVAAGTPDAPRRLRQAGSFMERAFENLPLGRLPRTATKQALAEPTVNAGRPLAPDALALLAEESQDYPYFVQLLGSAVWDAAAAARAPEIRAEVARHGLAHARAETSRFYGRRFAEARERGVHRALPALASLMEQPGARLDDAALDAFLDRAVVDGAGSGDPTRLQTTLQDLGILWEASPGRWEMGIPSFAQTRAGAQRVEAAALTRLAGVTAGTSTVAGLWASPAQKERPAGPLRDRRAVLFRLNRLVGLLSDQKVNLAESPIVRPFR